MFWPLFVSGPITNVVQLILERSTQETLMLMSKNTKNITMKYFTKETIYAKLAK